MSTRPNGRAPRRLPPARCVGMRLFGRVWAQSAGVVFSRKALGLPEDVWCWPSGFFAKTEFGTRARGAAREPIPHFLGAPRGAGVFLNILPKAGEIRGRLVGSRAGAASRRRRRRAARTRPERKPCPLILALLCPSRRRHQQSNAAKVSRSGLRLAKQGRRPQVLGVVLRDGGVEGERGAARAPRGHGRAARVFSPRGYVL